MSAQVAVLGGANVDLVTEVERLPRTGETVYACGSARYLGGKGANQAVAAARMGMQVAFFGKVGDDALAKEVITGLEKEEIDTSAVARTCGTSTGVASIIVAKGGNNMIVYVPGANSRVDPGYVKGILLRIGSAEVLLLQFEIPIGTIAYLLENLPPDRPLVLMDPAPAQPLDLLPLHRVDVLTPNLVELASLTGKEDIECAGKHLLQAGVRIVICKAGEQGAYLVAKEGMTHIPAFPVAAVDTTACGDAFNGALAAVLAEGRPIEEAIRWANAAGSLAATHHGAQPSLPARKEVLRLLKEVK